MWEMGGETYTQREDFFVPYILLGARGCQRLHPLASSSETLLTGCVSLTRLWFSALCLNLTAWFSARDLLPECPDRAVLFTNHNVTACQGTRDHWERTENPWDMLLSWEPYPSHHNGLFSPLLVLRDFAAGESDQYRCYPNSTRLLTFSM